MTVLYQSIGRTKRLKTAEFCFFYDHILEKFDCISVNSREYQILMEYGRFHHGRLVDREYKVSIVKLKSTVVLTVEYQGSIPFPKYFEKNYILLKSKPIYKRNIQQFKEDYPELII
ncbi:hypothetical protein WCWAEYFT_CDS0146 [Vibrio phage VB_VaC_TDDLMA]